MSSNNVQHAVIAGGTGNITLGPVSGAKRHSLLDDYSQGQHFYAAFKDGDDSEYGIYRIVTESPLVLERLLVKETISSSVFNKTNPTALDLTTSATFQIISDANALVYAPFPGGYPSGGIVGRPSLGDYNVDEVNTNAGIFRHMIPYARNWNGPITSLGIVCAVPQPSAVMRAYLYQKQYNNAPGVMYGEFTDTAEIDLSTAGIKVAAASSPIDITDSEFYVCLQASVNSVSVKGTTTSSGIWLGTEPDGTVIGSLYRSIDYASAGGDESASTWLPNRNKISVWLNGQ